MTAVPLLALGGVSAGYRSGAVVHELDLRVDAGEVVALIGANGAGATTIVLTISGLLAHTEGTIELLGDHHPERRRVTTRTVLRRARRGLAVVLDDRAVFGELTVAENLRLGRPRWTAIARGSSERHDARSAMTDAELFDRLPALAPLRHRRAGLLSGGEQQMLAIARAIVARPRLLVVDELGTGLAPATTELLLRLLRGLADEDGVGVLVVEQHVRRVLAVADRGYLLQRGRVVLSGTAAELTDRIDEVEAGYLDG